MFDQIMPDTESKMQKAIEILDGDFRKIRTGRAHPSLLENITVDYYGQMVALNTVSSIAISDARTLVVTPYEKQMVTPIDKAIRNSNLGLNPVAAGTTLRVPLPPLTEERRLDFVKQVKQEAEKARVVVRNLRRDANNLSKKLLKEKQISEDDDKKLQDKIQKLTDKYVAQVDKMTTEKEQEVLKV